MLLFRCRARTGRQADDRRLALKCVGRPALPVGPCLVWTVSRAVRRIDSGALPALLWQEALLPEAKSMPAIHRGVRRNPLGNLAHPEGLEPPTPRFVVWC